MLIIYYYDESKAGGINLWHNVACQNIIKQVGKFNHPVLARVVNKLAQY